ncbi:MAG: nucleotidyltransferase family protein [Oleiphilaceae bacterium]|nr:nucleotidyltransferase family protein [Oleiphilaceae bacterium]
MILAAGLGKRMRPLTDTQPKPLIQAGGKKLIEYHLERLQALGITEVVINIHWQAARIPEALGDGRQWGLSLRYSHEPELLETAGGIVQARPWDEKREPFLLINGDVYFDASLADFISESARVDGERCQALLAMVDNPPEHPCGDFVPGSSRGNFFQLSGVANESLAGLTYGGVSILHPALFDDLALGKAAPLAPLLRSGLADGLIHGWRLPGFWLDVGTPERLALLQRYLDALPH